jgi:S-adenosylmethionine hydrolase
VRRLPITFLSDYGHRDEFVGVCHGVIQRIAPGAVVIDIAHDLEPFDVRGAALVLRGALPYMPAGVHLGVVDPGVGTDRRAVAVRAGDGRLLVGPDNGLLWPALERFGGASAAVDISASSFRLEPVSATFHGRDLFAPVAAHLALGAALDEAGSPFPPSELERIDLPGPNVGRGEVTANVVALDRYGNAALDAEPHDLAAAGVEPGSALVVERAGERHDAVYARAFSEAGSSELLVHESARGALEIAMNRGSAATALALRPGERVRLLAPR